MIKKQNYIITSLVMFLFTVGLTFGAGFLYGNTIGELIRLIVIVTFCAAIFVFTYLYSFFAGKLDYDNAEHPYRFMHTFLAMLALSLLFPLIDKSAWVFLSFAVCLSLFSNAFTALSGATLLITISMMLSQNSEATAFIIYFVVSLFGVMLFQDIEADFQVGFSIFLSCLLLFVFETAGFILLANKDLSLEQFIMPTVNVFVNIIVLFWVLKYFNEYVANKYRNKYLELNDQEYKALIELKETSKEEYFRSIHTAYLVERIANKIGANVDVAKNLSYYHRLRKVYNYSPEECEKFVADNGFPPDCKIALLEFWDKSKPLITREASIVYLSDKMISTLMTLFAKDKTVEVDYEKLVNTLLDKKTLKDTLDESLLTQSDIVNIKKVLLMETLYYDFLR